MNLSEMRSVLDESGIQLTKSLGQNFLHDGNQLRRIVAAAELQPTDRVLEIGPGLGPLTEQLLEHAGEVFAVEKDLRLVTLLQKRLGAQPKLRLLHGDGLEIVRANASDWAGWKLVANLPYSVASPILVELASNVHPPERKTAPDVDSACITLVRRERELLPESLRTTFVRIAKRAFSQRRKMMVKLLKQDWEVERLEAAISALQISPLIRAEAVTLEQFVRLTEMLAAP